jgi:hypothetical protein
LCSRHEVREWWEADLAKAGDTPTYISLNRRAHILGPSFGHTLNHPLAGCPPHRRDHRCRRSVSPGSAILKLGTSGISFSISYPAEYPDAAKAITLR